jgi:hypothetical protein
VPVIVEVGVRGEVVNTVKLDVIFVLLPPLEVGPTLDVEFV